MTLRTITAPAAEPISRAEAKLHMRIPDAMTADDALIDAIIVAARQWAENRTRRALITQTLELTLPDWPRDGIITLPRPPLQYVESVKYVDTSGTLQTVAASEYQVDTYREPGQVKPAWNQSWDPVRYDFNAVRVRYVAGYAPGSPQDAVALREGVPEAIKTWLKMKANTLYNMRETIVVAGQVMEIPASAFDGLLDEYITGLFA